MGGSKKALLFAMLAAGRRRRCGLVHVRPQGTSTRDPARRSGDASRGRSREGSGTQGGTATPAQSAPVAATGTVAQGKSPAAASPDSANAKIAASRKAAPARDSTPKLEVNLAAPMIPRSIDVDAVTRGIEQATKAKVDSAQKPRIDDKAPIFKKP